MTDLVAVLATALAAGFLGSAHCVGMCSGVSGMIAVNANVRGMSTQIPLAIAYNSGRVISYAILGAIVASFGDVAVSAAPQVAGPIRLLSGLIIVLVGLQIAFEIKILAPLERAGAVLWQRIAPLASNIVPVTNAPRAVGLGLLWGWLPCGLVYSALLIAATTASATNGALTMIAFGIGTMPAMVMTGIGALTLSRFVGNARKTAGVLIILLGLLTLAMPLQGLMANDQNGHQQHHS